MVQICSFRTIYRGNGRFKFQLSCPVQIKYRKESHSEKKLYAVTRNCTDIFLIPLITDYRKWTNNERDLYTVLKARFFFRNRWPAELISPPGGLFPSDQKFRFQNCLIRGSRSELSFGKQPIFVLFWSLSSLTGATAIAAASEEVFLVFPLSEIVVVELEQNWMSSTLTGVLELDTPSHTDSYPSIAISCIKFQQFTKFSCNKCNFS